MPEQKDRTMFYIWAMSVIMPFIAALITSIFTGVTSKESLSFWAFTFFALTMPLLMLVLMMILFKIVNWFKTPQNPVKRFLDFLADCLEAALDKAIGDKQ